MGDEDLKIFCLWLQMVDYKFLPGHLSLSWRYFHHVIFIWSFSSHRRTVDPNRWSKIKYFFMSDTIKEFLVSKLSPMKKLPQNQVYPTQSVIFQTHLIWRFRALLLNGVIRNLKRICLENKKWFCSVVFYVRFYFWCFKT